MNEKDMIGSQLGILPTPKEEIAEIDRQIFELQKKKTAIEKTLMNQASTFLEKFEIWLDSDQGGHSDWIISREQFPVTRARYERWDLNRHREYDMTEDFEEDFGTLFEGEAEMQACWGDKWEAKRDEVLAIAKEMMDNNTKTFTCDW